VAFVVGLFLCRRRGPPFGRLGGAQRRNLRRDRLVNRSDVFPGFGDLALGSHDPLIFSLRGRECGSRSCGALRPRCLIALIPRCLTRGRGGLFARGDAGRQHCLPGLQPRDLGPKRITPRHALSLGWFDVLPVATERVRSSFLETVPFATSSVRADFAETFETGRATSVPRWAQPQRRCVR